MELISDKIFSFSTLIVGETFSPTLTMLMCLLLLVLAVKVAVKNWNIVNGGSFRSTVPGPMGLPIIGNILQLGKNPFDSFGKLAKQYGDVFQIRIGSRPVVVLNGRKAIQQALVKQSVDFAGRPTLESFGTQISVFEGSIAFSNYSESWKVHRKLVYMALRHFTSGSQAASVGRMVSFEASELVKFILRNDAGEGAVVESPKLLKAAVSNIMANFLFQARHSLDHKELEVVVGERDKFLRALSGSNTIDFMPWLGRLFPGKMRELKESHWRLRDILDVYLKEHETDYQHGVDSDIVFYLMTLIDDIAPEEREEHGISRDLVRPMVADLFSAGIDTVSGVLEWALVYSIFYPELQKQMQGEIDDVVGRDRLPSQADRGKLPLTESFLMEVTRHACIVPATPPHSTTRDTVLLGGYNYHIPEDTIIFVNLHSVCSDPAQFPEPEEFKPRRFISEDGTKLDIDKADSLMQFSVGRRRCIGSEVAQVEVFLFFTTLLHQCALGQVEGYEPSLTRDTSSIMAMPQPHKIHVTRRQ